MLKEAFLKAKNERRTALILFFPFGFPNIPESIRYINLLSEHADIVEIGLPFSDPVADGLTIQEAYEVALKNGANIYSFLNNLEKLSLNSNGLFMSYLNPVFKFGVEKLSKVIFKKNLTGFVFPDLPMEEKARLFSKVKQRLPVVLLSAPTDDKERIKLISKASEGFIYLVSSLGVTGTRKSFEEDVFRFAKVIKEYRSKFVSIGFGISSSEHVRKFKNHFDGIIVGSALVKIVAGAHTQKEAASDLIDFVSELKKETYLG